jgi:protein-tyrosine phosphatase
LKTKILMVCLGNICRSPLAEGILTSMLDPTIFEVHSAGTGSWHVGSAPDPRSIATASKKMLIFHSKEASISLPMIMKSMITSL